MGRDGASINLTLEVSLNDPVKSIACWQQAKAYLTFQGNTSCPISACVTEFLLPMK